MGYRLGIDLGTTWTAAAIARDDGVVEVVGLGTRATAVPTLVHVGADGVSVGETAARRGATEPDRLAREVKRRIGDTVPVLLGGQPYAPEALLAEVAAWVLTTVTALEGGPPDAVRVTHPANWGVLRCELLEGALRSRGIGPLSLVSEPEAAATHYASAERVQPGTTVAVYDLGGGTFDATVLRKTTNGFEVLGRPDGVDRLGGLDFDAAVLAHVVASLGEGWTQLDEIDPAVQAGVARLRDACVAAKEALSSDADASISVTLPGLVTDVRITRAEFEAMIRPALLTSVEALQRAVQGAGLQLEDVDRILLVGGSSRIPLVTELLAALGRPVTGDTHPKHAVALGAARGAGVSAPAPAAATTPWEPRPTPAIVPAAIATGSARRSLIAVALAVFLVGIAALGVTLLGGGDDPGADDDASPTSTPEATTSTIARLAMTDLGGSFALSLEVSDCEPAAACVGNTEIGLEVRCGNLSCTAGLDPDAQSREAHVETDGSFRFAGPGNPGSILFCTDPAPQTNWELVLRPTSASGGAVDALEGELSITAIGGCDTTLATFDVVGRPGEPGDQIAEVAGSWTIVDELPQCTGDGCSVGALAMPLVIDCVGATCTATLDGGEPAVLATSDVITEVGVSREASGVLPDGAGFTCGDQPVETSFGLSIDPQLDGQDRITGSLSLFADPGGPCAADTAYRAEFVGLPA